MLLPLTKCYIGFMTVLKSCEMIHSLGICFANNPSVCKSQRKQMPGSCCLRAHDRLKENVQLESAAVCGHRSPEEAGGQAEGERHFWNTYVHLRAVQGTCWVTSVSSAFPNGVLPYLPKTPCCQGHGCVTTKGSTKKSWPSGKTEVTRLTVLVLNHSSAALERNPVNVQEECERNRRLVFIYTNLLQE